MGYFYERGCTDYFKPVNDGTAVVLELMIFTILCLGPSPCVLDSARSGQGPEAEERQEEGDSQDGGEVPGTRAEADRTEEK